MKKFNVPQIYNGFCCYFKSTHSSFDKVIIFFTLSCLHLFSHFPFFHMKEFLNEIFYNLLLQIHIVAQIYHMFYVNHC
jgi:hypothetical protein